MSEETDPPNVDPAVRGKTLTKRLKKYSRKASFFSTSLLESSQLTLSKNLAPKVSNDLEPDQFQAISYDNVSQLTDPTLRAPLLRAAVPTSPKGSIMRSLSHTNLQGWRPPNAPDFLAQTAQEGVKAGSQNPKDIVFPPKVSRSLTNPGPNYKPAPISKDSMYQASRNNSNASLDPRRPSINTSVNGSTNGSIAGSVTDSSDISTSLNFTQSNAASADNVAHSSPQLGDRNITKFLDPFSKAVPTTLFAPPKRPITDLKTLQSFRMVTTNIDQMPSEKVVNKLFEKLLSVRVFPELSFKNTLTRRKWELLLSENENNADFDLRLLANAAMSSYNPAPSSHNIKNPKLVSYLPNLSVPMEEGVSSQQSTSQYSNRSSTATLDSTGADATTLNTLVKKQKIKEGSPLWYVTQIMANKATAKDYKRLAKKLESRSGKTWLQQFVDAQGETALSVILQKINKRSIKSNDDIEKEHQICMCLKIVISSASKDASKDSAKFEANDDDSQSLSSAEKDGQANKAKGRVFVINAIMHSLLSPSTATRLLVTKILVYFTHYSEYNYFPFILDGFTALQDTMGDFVKFQPWLNTFESAIDQHITMGYKGGSEQSFKNYVLTTLILVNTMIRQSEHRKERMSMRREFSESRLSKIFDKLRDIDDQNILQQIEEYIELTDEDSSEIQLEFSHLDYDDEIEHESFDNIFEKLRGCYENDTLDFSDDEIMDLNIVKNLLKSLTLFKETKSSNVVHKLLVLLDSVLNHLISELGILGYDSETVLNMTIHRLMDRMETDETAKRAVMETIELKKALKNLLDDKKILESQIHKISSNLTSKLRQEVEYAAETIDSQRHEISKLRDEITKLKKILSSRNRLTPMSFEHDKVVTETIDLTKSPSRSSLDLDTTAASIRSLKLIESEAAETAIGTKTRSKASITISSSDSLVSICTQLGNNNKDSKDESKTAGGLTKMINSSAQPPPPLSPPPPLPTFMADFNEDGSVAKGLLGLPKLDTSSIPLPPPPPPLPTSLFGSGPGSSSATGSRTSAVSAPPAPPPPPFLPELLKNGKNPLSALSGPSLPPPPPPPPLPNLDSPSTLISKSIDNFSETSKKEEDLAESLRNKNEELRAELAVLRPKTKLKQMHWSKIDDINDTFWRDIPNKELAEKLEEKGVLAKVEKAFVAKAPVIKSRPKADSLQNVKPSKITLLPRDLAQQFGINLHMFGNLSVEELFAKVLCCDQDILCNASVLEFFNSDALNDTPDSLKRAFLPYSVDFMRPETKPPKSAEELERADQIYLQIYNMRSYWKSRSRALLLMQSYRRDFQDLEQKLALIDEATESIRNSDGLRQVLAIIRSVGNFMNDDSKKAMGFKLDVLQRLKFMKDDSNSMTFLHYVEKIVRNNFPEFGSFVDELSILNKMHKIVVEQIEADCQEYIRNVANAINSIQKGNLSQSEHFHPEDKILVALKKPLDSAKLKSSLLKSHLERSIDSYCKLMRYFGENPNDASGRNSFFGKFAGFVSEFKKVHIENVQKEEDERAYEEKKQIIENRENARRAKDTNARDTSQGIQKDPSGSKSKNQPHSEYEKGEKNTKNNNDNDCDEDHEDENDDDEDDDEKHHEKGGENSPGGEDVIDKLLRELKHLGSDRRKRTRSMYTKRKSVNLETVSWAARDDEEIYLPVDTVGRYEHVDSLRRRMTTRRLKTSDGVTGVEELDVVMLRAQAMLSQLRNKSSGERQLTRAIPEDGCEQNAVNEASVAKAEDEEDEEEDEEDEEEDAEDAEDPDPEDAKEDVRQDANEDTVNETKGVQESAEANAEITAFEDKTQ